MSTRTETIPATNLQLGEGDSIARAEVKDGEIVLTIVTEDVRERTGSAGQAFLQRARELREHPADPSIWTDPAPRLRAILDR